jgi:hypothetical protein
MKIRFTDAGPFAIPIETSEGIFTVREAPSRGPDGKELVSLRADGNGRMLRLSGEMPRDAFKRALTNGIEIRDQDDSEVVAEIVTGLVSRGRAVAA